MPGPDAYPEMILASAQEEIATLARARARQDARRARGPAGRLASWWRRRATRRPRHAHDGEA